MNVIEIDTHFLKAYALEREHNGVFYYSKGRQGEQEISSLTTRPFWSWHGLSFFLSFIKPCFLFVLTIRA